MPSFNINQFASEIKDAGTLQNNKFNIEFVIPPIFSGVERFGEVSFSRKLQMRAETASLPSVILDTQNTNRYGLGPRQKFPTNVAFTDFSLSFIDDKQNNMYNYFSTWINSIFDFGATGERSTRSRISSTKYLNEYKKYYASPLMSVFIYSKEGTLVNNVGFVDVFPVGISEVGLGWSENNSVMKSKVIFSFREWFIDPITLRPYDSGQVPNPAVTASVPQTNPTPGN